MTSLLLSTIRPVRVERIRPVRVERLRAGAMAACLVLAAGCSSDSGIGSDQTAAGREPTDQVVQNDASSSGNQPGADDATNAGASELLAQAEVCGLVEPVASEVAAAFDAGFEVVGVHGTSGGCYLDLVAAAGDFLPARTEANLLVERAAAIVGDDVAAQAEAHEVQGDSQPAPSVSDDAVLLSDGDSRAVVLFSAGGRVWSLRSEVGVPDSSADVGGVDGPTVAAAEALLTALLDS